MKNFHRFRDDDSGSTAIEYGLIIALIAVAITTSISNLGNSVYTMFNKVSTTYSTATSNAGK